MSRQAAWKGGVAALAAAGLLALFGAGPPAETPAPIAERVLFELERHGEADILVIFRDRSDLEPARALPTREAKGRYVFEALTATARRSQEGLRARLNALDIPYDPHYLGNFIHLRADAALAQEIAARPEVARVEPNPEVPLSEAPSLETSAPGGIEWNVSRVGSPNLWTQGFTGQGVVVGIADTGVEWTHQALKPHYRGWNGTIASHDYNWHDAIAPTSEPIDDTDHGTHVTGIAVGDDGGTNQIGVAPGAKWMACRNMDQEVGTPARYTECFEFFLAPYPIGGDPVLDGDPTRAPDIINNSWLCPPSEGCSLDTLESIVESVRAAGILVVAAAGNAGPSCSTVDKPPAIYAATFSVGAVDSSDVIATFSSRGPVTIDGSGRLKPDLSAPGVSIRSSIRNGTYGLVSGTSMASPHVAGVAALLMAADPPLRNRPDRLEAMLRAGTDPRAATMACGMEAIGAVPNNTYGTGIVSAPASLNTDPDRDGVTAAQDNCPLVANSDQADADFDDVGDACDCAPLDPAVFAVPGEVPPSLVFNNAGTTLAWSATPGATSYDLYRASPPAGSPLSGIFSCASAGLSDTSASLSETPDSGGFRAYLVVGRNCFGTGPPGSGSVPRTLSPACP